MILRGLVVAAGGFLFIFSPGLPMSLLARRSPAFNRDMVYWGIGVWLVALLPSLFLQSLLRQAAQGGNAQAGPPAGMGWSLAGALLTALLVAAALAAVLRFRRRQLGALPPNGLALGFGVGLIAQVFTGLSLVGAGFRLMFGDVSTGTLAAVAQVGVPQLVLALLPLVLFRPALLAVSAARGVLVARAVGGRPALFWGAVLLDAAFVWGLVAVQSALGAASPGQLELAEFDGPVSAVTSLYCGLVFALAYRWLAGQIAGWQMQMKGAGRLDARP